VSYLRKCSRQLCGKSAVTTLTYIYSDSTAVVGPLAAIAEPHTYDLCKLHSQKLTAPRGWELIRLDAELENQTPSGDDLLALANAVREAARIPQHQQPVTPERPALRLVPPQPIEEDSRF
jgi:hypothetical protein